MPVPAVDPTTWNRVAATTQVALKTRKVDAKNMSFNDQLEALIRQYEDHDGRLRDFDGSNRTHSYWNDINNPNDKTFFRYQEADRGRDRRPTVEESVVDDLGKIVNREYPRLPTDSLSFQDQLSFYLDALQEFYAELDVYVNEENDN